MSKTPTKRERLADRLAAGPSWIGFKPSPSRPVRCTDGLSRPWNQTLQLDDGSFVPKERA